MPGSRNTASSGKAAWTDSMNICNNCKNRKKRRTSHEPEFDFLRELGKRSRFQLRRNMITNLASADNVRIVIQRVFKAPCALVYRAWTEPQHMRQWWHC